MFKKKFRVEIVLPVYNEEKELERNVEKLYLFLKKNLSQYLWHITIADNASTDQSLFLAKKIAQKKKEISAFHLDLKGRGRAVKMVWQKATADFFVYMDIDLSTDLYCLLPLLSSLEKGYDIAIGSRLLPQSKVINRPLKREILSRGYNFLIKMLFRTKFSDAQCGFKGVNKRVVRGLLPEILDNAWFFDSELLILGEKLGYKIYEVPVFWVDNPGSTVRVMKTVMGDLLGLWRLFFTRPWQKIKKI